jgi:hypothetical protein
MIRWLAAIAFVAAPVTPALATEWLSCADRDGAASIDVLLGAMEVIAVVGMTISVGDRVWASHVEYGPGEPIVVGQAFETSDALLLDAMDEKMVGIIAELRLFKAEAGDAPMAYGGTLRILDEGAWAVSCAGP